MKLRPGMLLQRMPCYGVPEFLIVLDVTEHTACFNPARGKLLHELFMGERVPSQDGIWINQAYFKDECFRIA